MPRAPIQPAELLTAEPFLGWWAVGEGLLTPDQLRSSAWRKVFRGVYVHRDIAVTHEVRARAACVLLPFAVVSGRSAAVLWGSTSPPPTMTWRSPSLPGPTRSGCPACVCAVPRCSVPTAHGVAAYR